MPSAPRSATVTQVSDGAAPLLAELVALGTSAEIADIGLFSFTEPSAKA